jgi:hypothetical protein
MAKTSKREEVREALLNLTNELNEEQTERRGLGGLIDLKFLL